MIGFYCFQDYLIPGLALFNPLFGLNNDGFASSFNY